MPKKLKRHLLKLLGLTGAYFTIIDGLGRAHLIMGLVAESDNYEKIGYAVTAVYSVIVVWFCWRFYTGFCRDGDFWVD